MPDRASKPATLGIDIGGSSIKAAVVDPETGALISNRYRAETPQPATPSALTAAIAKTTRHFDWSSPVGVTFPGIVRSGSIWLTANVDDSWLGLDASSLFGESTGCDVFVINDADAAGTAEVTYGRELDYSGVVLVLTLGTGIGSALFHDRALIPNTELGHLHLGQYGEAERWTAASIRKADGLSYKEWGNRLNHYLTHLEMLISPDLIVIGGAISNNFAEFQDQISTQSPVHPALLRNDAGVVGAAARASAEAR